MSFLDIVDRVTRLLRNQERISYRALKREFHLDDDELADLKEELIVAKRVARDEDGRVLIWTVQAQPDFSPPVGDQLPSPAIYTPAHLAERILAEQSAMASRGAAHGERKTITALFADLRASTALISRLDPEDAREIIDPVLDLMMAAVHRYEGYVAQALGDGIFALFGAPIAHEDHPQRALYAALLMQKDIRRFNRELRGNDAVPLQMRVGINTGEVVVRSIRKEDLHTDYIPVGYSTNLAARMEQKAAPGSIVVSEYTRKLTEGYFNLKSLGAIEIEGIGEPLNIYEVIGTGPLRTRLQVVARRGLTRFVGRKGELSTLRRALVQAKIGRGQMVAVVGELGLGKSRLFHEFKLASQKGCLVLEAYSVSHGKAFPFLPLTEMLKDYFQLVPSDDECARKEKITHKIMQLDRGLEDVIPYILWLLGLETSTSTLRQMDPQIRKTRKFEAVTRLFLRESLNQPLILVFEDLHWLDNETQSFLDTFVKALTSANILVLVNYRPEYRHEWESTMCCSQIRLAPLDCAETEELLSFLLGADQSLSPLKPILLERAEGTPFFLEEVVQTLSEEGVLAGERGRYRLEATPGRVYIPPTLKAVLAARIDRLQIEEKDLLQQLSVLGRQFSVGLAKQVITQPAQVLDRILLSLQEKEFLYEQPAFPQVRYHFKHALIQELAYSTVLQKQRKVLHEKTARALEALYPANLDEHYGELAHHYSHSDDIEKAVMYLGLAGQRAAQRSAYYDAIDYLNQTLALLDSLPDSPERTQRKIPFQITLAASFGAAKGYGSREFEQALSSARALCTRAEQAPQLSPVLYALRKMYMARGDLQRADELADHHLRLAQQLESPSVLLVAHLGRGMVSSGLGDFPRAHAHLDHALQLYDARDHRFHALHYGDDPGPLCYCYNALILWALGYPDRALAQIQDSINLADTLEHPLSAAWAHLFASMLHQYRRESAITLDHAKIVQEISREHGLPLFMGGATITQGWALADQNDAKAGIALVLKGLAMYQAAGARLWRPYFLAILASAHQKSGQSEEALQFLAQALAEAEKNNERQQEAELYRVRGELRLAAVNRQSNADGQYHYPDHVDRVNQDNAEADFTKALAIARRQKARSWELRAGVSLARLWQKQGKIKEARNLLTPIYEWFTEGVDTADLKDAKALIDEIESPRETAILDPSNQRL